MFWSILSKDRLCSFSVTLMRKHRLLWRCQLPWPHPHPLIQTTRKVWRGKGKKLKGKAVPMHSLHDAVFYSPLGSVWHGGNNLVLYPHFTAHNCSLIHLFFHPQFKIYKFHILHFQNLKIFCFLLIFCLWFFLIQWEWIASLVTQRWRDCSESCGIESSPSPLHPSMSWHLSVQ